MGTHAAIQCIHTFSTCTLFIQQLGTIGQCGEKLQAHHDSSQRDRIATILVVYMHRVHS